MLTRITKPHLTMKDGSTMLLDYAVECFAFLANTSNGVSTKQWEDMCLRFGPPDGVAFWMRIAWLSSQSCILYPSLN